MIRFWKPDQTKTRLSDFNLDLLQQRESLYLNLDDFTRERQKKVIKKITSGDIYELINRLNPRGLVPHFAVGMTAERPSVLPEVADDVVPTFFALDRQGIIWTRLTFKVNGVLTSLSGHDGNNDGISPTSIMAIDVIPFNYIFNGSNWDRQRSLVDNADNIAVGTAGHTATVSKLMVFDGTNWDRLRSIVDNADALATGNPGHVAGMSKLLLFNGATFDRVRSLVDNADSLAAGDPGHVGTVSKLMALNSGNSWDRVRCHRTDTDGMGTIGNGVLRTLAAGIVFDGTGFNRQRQASSSNFNTSSSTTGSLNGITLTATPGNWSVNHFPAVNVQATATIAAVAATRHVCTSIHFSMAAGATASGIVQCQVRDGATGAGTIIWSGAMAVPIGDSREISLSGLSIVGTANTAMTIEFSAAGGATTQQSVTMTGYNVS